MKQAKRMALAISVVAAGCSPEQQPAYPDLELDLPGTPPAVVQTLGERVVKTAASSGGQTTYGTGIVLSKDWVLTSGHVFADESVTCQKSWSARPAAPTEAPARYFTHNVVQTHNGLSDGNNPMDAALVGVQPQLPNMQPLAAADVRSTLVATGEPLFMFGYGAHDSTEQDRQSEGRLPGIDNPRLLGMIAIQDNDRLYAITGLVDYSAQPDAQRQPAVGDSGGPVVDEQGRLVGIVDQAWPAESQDDFQARIGRDLIGPLARNGSFSLLEIQPVTRDHIARLSQVTPVTCAP